MVRQQPNHRADGQHVLGISALEGVVTWYITYTVFQFEKSLARELV